MIPFLQTNRNRCYWLGIIPYLSIYTSQFYLWTSNNIPRTRTLWSLEVLVLVRLFNLRIYCRVLIFLKIEIQFIFRKINCEKLHSTTHTYIASLMRQSGYITSFIWGFEVSPSIIALSGNLILFNRSFDVWKEESLISH